MKILVTGAAGHLGEALMRLLRKSGREAVGIDIIKTPFVDGVGSIIDRGFVKGQMKGVGAVIHAATLHKPHVATHARQDFVDVNVTGTLNLLEEAHGAGVKTFVFTSTTSVFSDAIAAAGDQAALWVTEEMTPAPKNIYGVTKLAAEELCRLFHRKFGLDCLVLRTSRFFPEEDDNAAIRDGFEMENAKANEFLYRRVDIEDAANAHLLAVARAPDIGFGRYIISAATPFTQEDLGDLRADAPGVARRRVEGFAAAYERRGWKMFPSIDRVYVSACAQEELGWRPQYDFAYIVRQAAAMQPIGSALAHVIGAKGYHAESFAEGPYPVE